MTPLGPYKALKDLIGHLRVLLAPQGPYKALEGLMSPLRPSLAGSPVKRTALMKAFSCFIIGQGFL